MTCYFFDINDGDKFTKDDTGLELDGVESVHAEAARALPDIARDVLSRSDNERNVVVDVRDEEGRPALMAALTLLVKHAG